VDRPNETLGRTVLALLQEASKKRTKFARFCESVSGQENQDRDDGYDAEKGHIGRTKCI
jgi:hypothetical protein